MDSSMDSLPSHSIQESESSSDGLSLDTTPPNEADEILFNITTNTVAAAHVYSSKKYLALGHHFNQLFNYVNHIDQVNLAPFETRTIILAFLPDEKLKGRRKITEEETGSALEDANLLEHEKTYNSFEINGLCFFFVYKDEKSLTDLIENSIEKSITEKNIVISPISDTGNITPSEFQKSSRENSESPPDYQVFWTIFMFR
jgi:hypothetical protein